MEKISLHLPKEVRQEGKGDTSQQLWALKTVGLAAVFGFLSGLVAALVITSRLVDNWLYGQGSAGVVRDFLVYPSGRPLTRDELFKKVRVALVSLYRGRDLTGGPVPAFASLGAGFFLTNDGWLATSAASVGRLSAKELKVVTADQEILTVAQVVPDSATDLVFLKVTKTEKAVLPFAYSNNFEAGTELLAASTNQGLLKTEVLLSNFLPPRLRGDNYFSSDKIYRYGLLTANFPPASLGVPLLNNQGEVVGVIVKLNAPDLPRSLFLPAALVKSALGSLLASGGQAVRRPILGARFVEAGAAWQGERGVILRDDPSRGLGAVLKGSSLDKAGLKAYDKIVSVNNEPITELRTLPEIILDYAPGSQVNLVYERAGQVFNAAVSLTTH